MSARGDAYLTADRLRKRRERAARSAASGAPSARAPRDPLLERHAAAMHAIRDDLAMTAGQRLDALGMVVWGRRYAPLDV